MAHDPGVAHAALPVAAHVVVALGDELNSTSKSFLKIEGIEYLVRSTVCTRSTYMYT